MNDTLLGMPFGRRQTSWLFYTRRPSSWTRDCKSNTISLVLGVEDLNSVSPALLPLIYLPVRKYRKVTNESVNHYWAFLFCSVFAGVRQDLWFCIFSAGVHSGVAWWKELGISSDRIRHANPPSVVWTSTTVSVHFNRQAMFVLQCFSLLHLHFIFVVCFVFWAGTQQRMCWRG